MNPKFENTMGRLFEKRRSKFDSLLSDLINLHGIIHYIVNVRKESNIVNQTYSCMSFDEIRHQNKLLIKMYDYTSSNFDFYRKSDVYKYIIDNLSKEMTIVNEFYCQA